MASAEQLTCKHLHLKKIANMGLKPDDLVYRCEECNAFLSVKLWPYRITVVRDGVEEKP